MPARSYGHSADTESATKPTDQQSVAAVRPASGNLITDKLVAKLKPPTSGSWILYDSQVPGFGVRVTAGCVVSFVLNYRAHGRERRHTIGRYPEISALKARATALQLRQDVRDGHDPLAERNRARTVPTLQEFTQKYLRDHAELEKRPKSVREDKRLLEAIILPRLGRFALDAIARADIETLRRDLAATPVQANRVLALLHTMFELAKRWENLDVNAVNPARGVKRYHEEKRTRWLQEGELKRLLEILDRADDQQAANVLRLMLLTGSRKGEALSATWDQFDLESGTWTKPSHTTKQKKTETIPLSPPALELLKQMARSRSAEYLFPGRNEGDHRQDVKNLWEWIRKEADIADVRAHDLRHTFASHLVSNGAPLKLVGALLGHAQAHTTERYAHVADRALRNVTNQFGVIYQKTKRTPRRPR